MTARSRSLLDPDGVPRCSGRARSNKKRDTSRRSWPAVEGEHRLDIKDTWNTPEGHTTTRTVRTPVAVSKTQKRLVTSMRSHQTHVALRRFEALHAKNFEENGI